MMSNPIANDRTKSDLPPDHMVREVEDDSLGWPGVLYDNWPIYLDLIEGVISGALNEKSSVMYIGYIFMFDFLKLMAAYYKPLESNQPDANLRWLDCPVKTPPEDIKSGAVGIGSPYYIPVCFIIEYGQAVAFASLVNYSSTSLGVFFMLASLQCFFLYRGSKIDLRDSARHPPYIVLNYRQRSMVTYFRQLFIFDIISIILVATENVPN